MMKFNNTFLALALCCMAAQAQAQTWGNLKVRFVLDGAMPAAEEVKVPANAAFCGDFKQVDESLVVNKENNGIANVYVYAYTSGRDSVELPSIHPDLKDAESKTYELANKNCRFEPHALLLRTGDKLKVTNPDKVGHNAHIFFFENPESNLLIPPGKEQVLAVDLPERAPTNVTCDIHPWMTGKVHVIDHPYGAISDKDGKVSIANIPAGTKLAFRVVHEKARKLSGTKVGDSELSRRNVFEVTLTEGDNDLGEVKVPVSAFEG